MRLKFSNIKKAFVLEETNVTTIITTIMFIKNSGLTS